MKITYNGLINLENELKDLTLNQRKDIATKIRDAREQGDISENADYDAAIEERNKIELRINEIKNMLVNVEVYSDDDIEEGIINIGCTVKVYDIEFEEEVEYKIVGSSETNSLQNKISDESPLGKELINRKVGDIITIHTPNGTNEFTILEIKNS